MDIKKFVTDYEQNLATKIAHALGIKTENVVAKWDQTEPQVTIRLVSGAAVTIYKFIYNVNTDILTMNGSSMLYITEDDVVVGVQAKPIGIDLVTFQAIHDLIANNEEQENSETTELKEEVDKNEDKEEA